jgi:NAD(P)-dependent dehydrogenase (short-subunit alcohol dehydrogenase family)
MISKMIADDNQGIGRATAIAFARDGCKKIALGDLSLPGLEETRALVLKAHPDAVVEVSRLDVTDEELVKQFYANAVAKFGSIDYAANVAGVPQAAAPIHKLTMATYDKSFAVNQKGVRDHGRFNYVVRRGQGMLIM